jgi:hypothetical protein
VFDARSCSSLHCFVMLPVFCRVSVTVKGSIVTLHPKAAAVKASRCLLRAVSLGRAAHPCPLPGGVLCSTLMCCTRICGVHHQERCCALLWLFRRYSHAALCHGSAE